MKNKVKETPQQIIKRMRKEGYYFIPKEVSILVKEAKKIGFTPLRYLTTDKKFYKSKVRDSIYFSFMVDKEVKQLDVRKWEIENLGLNVLKDKVSTIFFSLLFKEIDDMEYQYNYEG